MNIISFILVFLAFVMVHLAIHYIQMPLPPLEWGKLTDVLFASGFSLLNIANLYNILVYKLRVDPFV